MKDRQKESGPALVPAEGVTPKAAKQAGEVGRRWRYVEPSVWTERMLTALEAGVKGGKTPSLPSRGSLVCLRLMRRCVNPQGGEPPTGEPYAGDPPVRFGGRGAKALLPLSQS